MQLVQGGGSLQLGSGALIAQAAGTATLPSPVAAGVGAVVVVINSHATDAATLAATGGSTLYASGSAVTTLAARSTLTFVSDGANWYSIAA